MKAGGEHMVMINYLIATINEFDNEHNIFVSLRRQKCQKFNVIIVHQGDKAFDFSLLDGLNFMYINTKNYGLSYARNLGISKCEAPYISILDDDASIEPSYTDSLLNKFDSVLCDGVCGVVLDPLTAKPLSRSLVKNRSFSMDRADYNYFMSSAVTLKTQILKSNYFDEDFGIGALYGASEETDIFWRVVGNYSLAYDPQIIVYHPSDNHKIAQMSLKKIFYRGFNYGLGRGAVIKKHTSTSSWFFYVYFKSISLLFLVLFYDIFSFNFKFFIRDIGSLIGRLLGFLRYSRF